MRTGAYLPALLVFLLLGSCAPRPDLSQAEQQWRLFNSPLRFGPLRVSEHGFKFIQARRVPEVSKNRRTVPAHDVVDWGWRVVVRTNNHHLSELDRLLYLKHGESVVTSSTTCVTRMGF